ncbi:adhesion G-protein coupled receptor D1-like [Ptychodera flava]|uniref:adhesion G-protein coupled receptor D1-like n=1 Tax=Ptychodera flava TaxID=63121 RepID=UPI00396A2912
MESRSGRQVTCHCDHTTNFAILLQIVPFKLDPHHGQILCYISQIGGAISLVALMVAFLLYCCLRSTMVSERMLIHKNLLVAMFILQLTIIVSSAMTNQKILCKVSAAVIHYFATAMFLWMLVEGLQLYRQVVRVYGSEISWMIYYYLISWGLPALIVSVTIAVGWKDYGGGQSCWLSNENGLIWFFAGPVLTIILINTFILICVVKVVYTASEGRDGNQYNKDSASRASIRSTLMLLPLLGLTWLLGFLAVNNDTIVFLYLFTILNSLQGLFIFIFHILLNTEMRNAIKRKKHIREMTRMEFISSTAGMSTSHRHNTSSNACYTHDGEDYVIATPPRIIIDDPVLTSFASIKDQVDGNFVTSLNCPDNVDGK